MELDLKNKKILSELEMNARISYSALGKRVGLSKQVVKYRIEKLESENIIQGYNALVDVGRLGETIYVVYFKLVQISSSKEKEWIDEIDKNPNVLGVGKNAGHWDLTIAIRCKNNQELDDVIKKITSGKSEKIKEKLITSEIESVYFNTKLLHEGKVYEANTSEFQEDLEIDDKDKKIIHLLSENCRTSLLELSEKINMSPNGIKNKIKSLEKKKIIIGYKTKLNYEKLGYLHFRVFLHLSKFTKELYNNIKSFLKSKGSTESVSRYIGYADVDFRCYSKTIEEFYSLLSEIRDNFLQNIIEIDSMPIFRWERISYYSKK
ncbi:MAG TPA: AsnC family transcriptional regulator [Candidatus Paceibacterota bacterium]|nr:AsnC family transcriptional regulator [Candidatus Paceibacterota bacterium]